MSWVFSIPIYRSLYKGTVRATILGPHLECSYGLYFVKVSTVEQGRCALNMADKSPLVVIRVWGGVLKCPKIRNRYIPKLPFHSKKLPLISRYIYMQSTK